MHEVFTGINFISKTNGRICTKAHNVKCRERIGSENLKPKRWILTR